MSRGWKATVIVLAVLGTASTPLIWLLNSPDAGQLVGATVQGAVSITALVWAVFQPSGNGTDDSVVRSGPVDVGGGGAGNTGIWRRRRWGGGRARVADSGSVTSTGKGSDGNTGIRYR
ncbi:hypothetical protein [Streptomyces syringium]|uniref:hypothetical protein n=1 Tax=Streptomyces syringium TaxID=76729 RepID=UPI0033CD04BA